MYPIAAPEHAEIHKLAAVGRPGRAGNGPFIPLRYK